MKNLLVFDLDGTLIDSRQDLATGVNLMREHLDYRNWNARLSLITLGMVFQN